MLAIKLELNLEVRLFIITLLCKHLNENKISLIEKVIIYVYINDT
jgi:hypothetical protein